MYGSAINFNEAIGKSHLKIKQRNLLKEQEWKRRHGLSDSSDRLQANSSSAQSK